MYAALTDMVSLYGEAEILRLGALDGDFPDQVTDLRVEARVARALDSATDLIDSYLRKRYRTPLETVQASIRDAACAIARHTLASTGQTSPSEDVARQYKTTIDWLGQIARGVVTLEGAAPVAQGSAAQFQDRDPIYDTGAGGMW